MIPRIDFETFGFETPLYLWLLILPAVLTLLWLFALTRRRGEARRLVQQRYVPTRERYSRAGDLGFWFCAIVAAALCLVAVAGPRARVSVLRKASADIVILQDGSASMYTRDVTPDRWRRSVRFLRTFAESLSWRGDRVALALFAHLAAPQVRLTRDPNALFFFLDHLGEHSPFLLADNPTWDTNIEEGIRWGLRLVETDERLFGKSGNPKAFLVITDGQAWSGSVGVTLRDARARHIPVFVVGVGTTAGGIIPAPLAAAGGAAAVQATAIRAVLDRGSLLQIAVAGGGEYFEIGRESDRDTAFRIIDRIHRSSDVTQQVVTFEALYWRFLLAAGIVLCLGTLMLHKRAELAWQALGALAVLVMLVGMLR